MNNKQPRLEIYNAGRSGWRWRVVANNGKILSVSSEGYTRKRGAVNSAEKTMHALVLALSERER